MKGLKFQTPAIIFLMVQSRNFGNFMKLTFALIPKYCFNPMTGSAIMQMYKKNLCQKEIVSKVETQLNIIYFS
jgi:hypothetical protein